MKPRKYWSLSEVQQEAKKYLSRAVFAKESGGAYQWAWRRKVLDSVCAHMPMSEIYSEKKWRNETVAEEALKYFKRSDFRKGNEGAYGYALNNGILDEVCSHMPVLQNSWDEESIRKEAEKYTSRHEFKKTSPTAYKVACRKGVLETVCAHMEPVQRWSKESVLIEASKHETQSEFRFKGRGAFNHARNNGYLEEACAHMSPAKYGFDPEKPASLYCIKITGNDGKSLFKVGITNRNASLRAMGLGAKSRNNVEIINEIRFERGVHARSAERQIHNRYKGLKYYGDPIMSNGNKEMFYENVLVLHQADQGT